MKQMRYSKQSTNEQDLSKFPKNYLEKDYRKNEEFKTEENIFDIFQLEKYEEVSLNRIFLSG